MNDQDRTNKQLINELESLRRRVAELEESETALKKTGQLLRESEQRYKAVVDNIEIGISVLNPNLEIVEVNKAFKKYFPHVLPGTGQICYEQYNDPAGSEPCWYCPCVLTLRDGEVHEAITETPAGSEIRNYRLVSSPIKDSDGKLQFVIDLTEDITARKKAEEALDRANQDWELTFNAISDLVMVLDTQHTIRRANRAMADALGMAVHDLIGRHCFELVHGEQGPPGFCPHSQLLADGKEHSAEVVEPRLRGIFDVRVSPLVGRDGQVIGSVHVTRDIAERKRAEEALRNLNRELRAISSCNQALLRAVDEQTLLDEICRIICDEAGYALAWVGYAENDVAKTVRPVASAGFDSGYVANAELSWSDDTERGRGPAGIAIRSGEVVHVQDFTIDPRMATWRESARQRGYRSGIALPLRDESEQVFGVLLIYSSEPNVITSDEVRLMEELSHDLAFGIITLRVRVERKLAEEKNLLLAAIVEFSDDAIIGKDLDGIITSWNRGAERIYGWKENEVLGKPITLLVPRERQGEVSMFLKRIKQGEHVEHHETVRRKKDGREIDLSLTISPIRDTEGKIIGASTVARDITEQKSLQRQLVQAQRMESIATLAGGIAHDFNNLLQVVVGYSDMLLFRKKPTDPEYEGLHAIRQAGRDGSELAKRMLTFGRRMEPNVRPVNLNNEILRLEKMLRRTVPKMIQIEILLGDKLKTVNADPSQVEQVLLNLVINAQHAMPDGGRLTIETSNVMLGKEYLRTHLNVEPGEYVLMMVSDTGHGMEKEVLARIFEPFFTTKAAREGTGLGLAMVYGIVKSHGGIITCYSEPSKGTTFKIYLPAIVREIEKDFATTTTIPAFGTETILLVDDEESVRKVGTQILRMAGYNVLTATNGREAIDVYNSNRGKIDLVLLDLIMPEMGGKHSLMELLKIDPKLKVVIASGYSVNGPTKDAIEAGAKGFISKPYDMKQVLQVVRRVLDQE